MQAEGRIKERRENEDVNRRELVLQLEENRKLVLDSIKEAATLVGTGVRDFLGDRERLTRGVLAFG